MEVLLGLLGGSGLLLLGLRLFSEAMENLYSPLLRWGVNSVGRTPFSALISGAMTSFFLQSSVSASFMGLSLGRSGLLVGAQIYAFLLGTSMGTALTSALLLLPVTSLYLVLMGLSAPTMFFAQSTKIKNLSQIVFSLGLIFMGFIIMRVLLSPEKGEALGDLLSQPLPHGTLLGVGILIALLLRSSVAGLAIVIALTGFAQLSSLAAIQLVMGINLGTVILPGLLALKGGSPMGKVAWYRAAAHLPVIGFFLLTETHYWAPGFLSPLGTEGTVALLWIPLFQGLYCLVVALCGMALLPLIKSQLLPAEGKGKQMQKLSYQGDLSHLSPLLSLEQIHQELRKMSAMVETILQMTYNSIMSRLPDQAEVDRVYKYEGVTDNIRNEVLSTLIQVNQKSLTLSQAKRVAAYDQICERLEGVADRCKAIFYLRFESRNKNDPIVDELRGLLQSYLQRTLEEYEGFFLGFTGEKLNPATSDELNQAKRGFEEEALNLRTQWLQSVSSLNQVNEETFALHEILLGLMEIRNLTHQLKLSMLSLES